jgi:hypothetical protein
MVHFLVTTFPQIIHSVAARVPVVCTVCVFVQLASNGEYMEGNCCQWLLSIGISWIQ